MWTELKNEGRTAQFVVVSDSNASDFVSRVTMPIFKDPSAGRAAWFELDASALKHDTFVFDAQGRRVATLKLNGGLSSTWRADVAAAVRALPP